jgi:uncharacterized protein (TIGR03000 family)
MRFIGELWGCITLSGFVMIHRLFGPCGAAAFITICVAMPRAGLAQAPTPAVPSLPPPALVPPGPTPPGSDAALIRRQDWEGALNPAPYPQPDCPGNWQVGITAGPGGYYHSGWPYGPQVAPPWGYPGLMGGPFVGYPWGWPGYSGRAGQNWSNGLSLYGPPVPVYGPVPGIMGNGDLVKQWHDVPSLGIGYGWFGVYAASPRPRPLTVNVWPVIENMPAPTAPVAPAPADPGAAAPGAGAILILSVKLPQPAAEVLVNGVKTTQTGTDRLYESPPLDAGRQYKYELTARWVEGGATREVKKAVLGTPGEVVRVDFTMQ